MTVLVPCPTEAEIQENVRRSTEALRRALIRLTKPGVSIRRKWGVPLFYVDENDPDIFIRELNGKTERGVIEDGGFKALD